MIVETVKNKTVKNKTVKKTVFINITIQGICQIRRVEDEKVMHNSVVLCTYNAFYKTVDLVPWNTFFPRLYFSPMVLKEETKTKKRKIDGLA